MCFNSRSGTLPSPHRVTEEDSERLGCGLRITMSPRFDVRSPALLTKKSGGRPSGIRSREREHRGGDQEADCRERSAGLNRIPARPLRRSRCRTPVPAPRGASWVLDMTAGLVEERLVVHGAQAGPSPEEITDRQREAVRAVEMPSVHPGLMVEESHEVADGSHVTPHRVSLRIVRGPARQQRRFAVDLVEVFIVEIEFLKKAVGGANGHRRWSHLRLNRLINGPQDDRIGGVAVEGAGETANRFSPASVRESLLPADRPNRDDPADRPQNSQAHGGVDPTARPKPNQNNHGTHKKSDDQPACKRGQAVGVETDPALVKHGFGRAGHGLRRVGARSGRNFRPGSTGGFSA